MPLLKAYAYLIDSFVSPFTKEPPAIEHRLQKCPKLNVTRHNIFGSSSPFLKLLIIISKGVLAFGRVTPA